MAALRSFITALLLALPTLVYCKSVRISEIVDDNDDAKSGYLELTSPNDQIKLSEPLILTVGIGDDLPAILEKTVTLDIDAGRDITPLYADHTIKMGKAWERNISVTFSSKVAPKDRGPIPVNITISVGDRTASLNISLIDNRGECGLAILL